MKKRIKQPGEGPKAHGATKAPKIVEDKDDYSPFDFQLQFGSTVATFGGCEYPVAYYGLENIKALHSWLGKVITYIEAKQSGQEGKANE